MKPLAPFHGVISPLAMEAAGRYLKKKEEVPNHTSLKIVCLILLAFAVFNSLFAIMMVLKYSLIIQENAQLIQENRQLIYYLQQSPVLSLRFMSKSQNIKDDENADYETERFAKMVDIRDCPPCTTETPVVVTPHKNPVSMLNELEMGKTQYDCQHACLNPPIHISTLKINKPELIDKSWVGKGKSISASKQVAAYRALKDLYPNLLDDIADEHIPDETYTPSCNDRMENQTLLEASGRC